MTQDNDFDIFSCCEKKEKEMKSNSKRCESHGYRGKNVLHNVFSVYDCV